MKATNILLYLSVLLLFLSCSEKKPVASENFKLHSPEPGVLYRYINNPVNAEALGYDCKEIAIEVTNAKKVGKDCVNIVIPLEGESCIVKLFTRADSSNVLYEQEIPVKTIPLPKAAFDYYNADSTSIPTSFFPKAKGLRPYMTDFPYATKLYVRSFEMEATFRDQGRTFASNSARLTTDMKGALQNVKSGDKIKFQKIICKGEGGEEYKLEDLEFDVR